ncbi:23S rRNA (pseudouridine(1915)-N(3))-methyltransferase RlmH [Granulicella sp. S156]|uniref:23S rRNA (pseudouridine(1915)-N(3))-methyltransferase RlmH n=1 Tax=Granulicella sp. S156 TaxID=1747224 RepID=UPI00131E168D|nr:23S rRNA (pseudouridine(1915)-N(3))-methyltransferase RlmH [Granulicella sp. S156]
MQFCRPTMEILLATIRPRRSPASEPDAQLLERYIQRSSRYVPCEQREFASEATLFAHLDRPARRTTPYLVLTDSRGKQMSSEEFAAALGSVQDNGVQQLVVAIGPADGWSAEALRHASLTVAFGRITLPHELAAVVAAEQIYRALTIRAGHPYHHGH